MKKILTMAAVSVLALSLPAFQAQAKKGGASAFAPGQLSKQAGAKPAKFYAPGQMQKRTGLPARNFAPGQVKKKPVETTGSGFRANTSVRVRAR